MEVTLTEVILFAWAMLATAQWLQLREEFKEWRFMTVVTLRKIHKGEVKIIDNGDTFELRDVK